MSARDELAQTVEAALDSSHGIIAWTGAAQEDIADAILAAGYRKPRTITTVEELDALAIGSVILDRDGDAWQRYRPGWTCTDRALNTQNQPSASLVNILGPAVLVHEATA